MKVYIVYWSDHEEWNIEKIFSNKEEAIIYASEHNFNVEEHEVIDGMYDVSKYTFYNYYSIITDPHSHDPIRWISKNVTTRYDLIDPAKQRINISCGDVYNVIADSEEEAKEIFYNAFKEAMDKYYEDNHVYRQNGKIKTWKKP